MKLIVGLGNPGEKYKNTRHNLGFMVVDKLVSSIKYQVSWEENKKFKSLVAKIDNVIFVKPQTYMNLSGAAIKSLTTYYKLPTTNIIVVHDELDLPLGKIKVRSGGSAAGHHGVESVIEKLRDDQFIRVRLGIGPDKKGTHFNAEKFVVEEFLSNEKHVVKKMVEKAVEAVELLLKEGLESVQNQFN